VHGRTRADAFRGEAEYDTIAAVKSRVSIPVIANGDIDSPEKALWVKRRTGADALMIGRAAQGRPWIFREIACFLDSGETMLSPSLDEIRCVLHGHLLELHAFYGEFPGVRVARKHVSWYTAPFAGSTAFRHQFNRLDSALAQLEALDAYFAQLERDGNGLEANAREELAA